MDPKYIDEVMITSNEAFKKYRNLDPEKRSQFLSALADKLSTERNKLIAIARSETNLEESRLRTELARTCYQLKNYGDAMVSSERITGTRKSITKEGVVIRKMNIPVGPVVVFGASNFPFAYSTAGGDTASALAAGCSVIVKGHPAHIRTSRAVSEIIIQCINEHNLPAGIFQHMEGFETGELLVRHPITKSVAFTGSLEGGRQIFDWGNQRPVPVPVFAEMGSLNPVYILPGFDGDPEKFSALLASSIMASSGQFCTKPGFIIGIDGEIFTRFIHLLACQIQNIIPSVMLHEGIYKNFEEKLSNTINLNDVTVIVKSKHKATEKEGQPTLASCTAQTFLSDKTLRQEIFGPFSLVIRCRDIPEMKNVAESMEGQLTATIWSSPETLKDHPDLLEDIREKCGRLIFNGVPTGVEVCDAMHHGGPYPATTDSRFTSVGSDAVLRFLRPVTYQGLPEELLF